MKRKHIKLFEDFSSKYLSKIDEGQDMFTLPVDPIKGSAQVYGDIAEAIGSRFNEAVMKMEDTAESVVEDLGNRSFEVLESIERYFGVPADRLTYNMIVANLKGIKESFSDRYNEADPYDGHKETMDTPLKDVKGGPIQKIGNILQNICGINLLTFGMLGSFLTWLMGISPTTPVMSMIYSIVAFVIIHIVRKLATMAGM
jgi:hypothetical protein